MMKEHLTTVIKCEKCGSYVKVSRHTPEECKKRQLKREREKK